MELRESRCRKRESLRKRRRQAKNIRVGTQRRFPEGKDEENFERQ